MKRSEMILKIEEMLVEAPADVTKAAESILARLEKAGMTPPRVDEDRFQVLMNIYVFPNGHMWDEEFDEKPKLVEVLRERLKRKKK